MRLFEVEDRFSNDLTMVLRNLLGRSDSKHSSIKLSYDALSNLIKNLGYGGINYATFNKMYDQNPGIQAMVKDYNEAGVELGTEVDRQAEPTSQEEPTSPDTGNSQTVQTMARNANPYM
jgi:hypothetical protein